MTKLVAHRGYSARYPENTLRAARAAITAGACGIEFDVQMCGDGELIVIHDDNLQRTCGVDVSVFDHGLAELQQHSAHEAARFGEDYAPEKIPSLRQMLNFVACCRGLITLIEIKEESIERWGAEKVISRLCEMITPLSAQCVLISFSEAAIREAQKHDGIRVGWVLHKYDSAHRKTAENLKPNFLICNQSKISTAELWSGDWQWMLYGVETAELAQAWNERGVAYLETDYIGELLQDDNLRRHACCYD